MVVINFSCALILRTFSLYLEKYVFLTLAYSSRSDVNSLSLLSFETAEHEFMNSEFSLEAHFTVLFVCASIYALLAAACNLKLTILKRFYVCAIIFANSRSSHGAACLRLVSHCMHGFTAFTNFIFAVC